MRLGTMWENYKAWIWNHSCSNLGLPAFDIWWNDVVYYGWENSTASLDRLPPTCLSKKDASVELLKLIVVYAIYLTFCDS